MWYCYFALTSLGAGVVYLLGSSSLKSCRVSRQLAVVTAYIPNLGFWASSHFEILAFVKCGLHIRVLPKQILHYFLKVCAEKKIQKIWHLRETFHKTEVHESRFNHKMHKWRTHCCYLIPQIMQTGKKDESRNRNKQTPCFAVACFPSGSMCCQRWVIMAKSVYRQKVWQLSYSFTMFSLSWIIILGFG